MIASAICNSPYRIVPLCNESSPLEHSGKKIYCSAARPQRWSSARIIFVGISILTLRRLLTSVLAIIAIGTESDCKLTRLKRILIALNRIMLGLAVNIGLFPHSLEIFPRTAFHTCGSGRYHVALQMFYLPHRLETCC